MNFPKSETWVFENGDEVELYSYHHIRVYEIEQEINGMTKERYRQTSQMTPQPHPLGMVTMDVI